MDWIWWQSRNVFDWTILLTNGEYTVCDLRMWVGTAAAVFAMGPNVSSTTSESDRFRCVMEGEGNGVDGVDAAMSMLFVVAMLVAVMLWCARCCFYVGNESRRDLDRVIKMSFLLRSIVLVMSLAAEFHRQNKSVNRILLLWILLLANHARNSFHYVKKWPPPTTERVDHINIVETISLVILFRQCAWQMQGTMYLELMIYGCRWYTI